MFLIFETTNAKDFVKFFVEFERKDFKFLFQEI
jgi:hypothetical protein